MKYMKFIISIIQHKFSPGGNVVKSLQLRNNMGMFFNIFSLIFVRDEGHSIIWSPFLTST